MCFRDLGPGQRSLELFAVGSITWFPLKGSFEGDIGVNIDVDMELKRGHP